MVIFTYFIWISMEILSVLVPLYPVYGYAVGFDELLLIAPDGNFVIFYFTPSHLAI